jgi:hypothetical protein
MTESINDAVLLYITRPLKYSTRVILIDYINTIVNDKYRDIFHLIANSRIQAGTIPEGVYQIDKCSYFVSDRYKVYVLRPHSPHRDDIYTLPLLTTSTFPIDNGIPVDVYEINDVIKDEILNYKIKNIDISNMKPQEILELKQNMLQEAYEIENDIQRITEDNIFRQAHLRYY